MQFTAHIASHMEFSHSKQWKEFEVSVTEGVEETNHTGGTKESGDMTMDDRGGDPSVDCHFIRDEYLTGNIAPTYVPTHAQLADIFTKALGLTQFTSLLCKLGICNLHIPT